MNQSIRRRFVVTLGANSFRSAISFATGLLLARWLGPEAYGKLAFLLAAFLALRTLLDLGSSSAFFTFLSQKARSRRFVAWYFGWMGVQFIACVACIGLLFPADWVASIWQGQPRGLVLLAFVAVFLQSNVWVVVAQAAESQRQTTLAQTAAIGIALIHLAAMVLLYRFGDLGLYAVLAAVAVEHAIASWVVQRRFQFAAEGQADPEDDQPRLVLRKYLRFCMPMVPYTLVGFAAEFADRWILQRYGGSVEQAYFSVGVQFSLVALIATTSILRIFWKEIAEANHQGDHERMGRIYRKVSRLLYLVAAMISGFLVPWAGEISSLILGPEYVGGATTLAVMFLFPLHQSLGQIVGTLLYATERVDIQVQTGIAMMLVGIIATYFVLAPPNAAVPGLGLGSEGLAWKRVLITILQVNLSIYIIARVWKWAFDWRYQPVAFLACSGLGWLARGACSAVLGDMVPTPVLIMMSGVLFMAGVVVMVFGMPWLIGMTRNELLANVRKFWLVVRIAMMRR